MNCEEENKKNDQIPSISAEMQRRFLDERKIFLWDSVTDKSAAEIVEKLLYLDMLDHEKEITFYTKVSVNMQLYQYCIA